MFKSLCPVGGLLGFHMLPMVSNENVQFQLPAAVLFFAEVAESRTNILSECGSDKASQKTLRVHQQGPLVPTP